MGCARRRCSTSRSRATHHTSIASLTTAFGNHSKAARPARVSHPAALPLPQASTTSCCSRAARTPAARRCRPTFRTRSCTPRRSCGCCHTHSRFLLTSISPIPTGTPRPSCGCCSIWACRASSATPSPPRICRAWCEGDASRTWRLTRAAPLLTPLLFPLQVRPVVVCIILIMSSVGTVTGFFLQYLDSVRKAVAGAVEVALATLAHTTPPPASRLSHMRPPRSHRSSSRPCSRGRSSAPRWTHSRCWRR